MILDYSKTGEAERLWQNGRVLLDGVEVKSVFYVDTKAGLVKTYDVLSHPEAKVWIEYPRPMAIVGMDWRKVFDLKLPSGVDGTLRGPLYWTRCGKVELFTAAEWEARQDKRKEST